MDLVGESPETQNSGFICQKQNAETHTQPGLRGAATHCEIVTARSISIEPGRAFLFTI
jgi:hypothetical protein